MGCSGSKKQNKLEVLIDQLKVKFIQCDQELEKKQKQINNLQEENKIHQIKIAENEKLLLIKKKFALQNQILQLQEQNGQILDTQQKAIIAQTQKEAIQQQVVHMQNVVTIIKDNREKQDKVDDLKIELNELEEEEKQKKVQGIEFQDPELQEYIRENEQQLKTQVNGNPIQKSDVQLKPPLDYPNLESQFQPLEINQQQSNLQKVSYHSQLIYE